ncbi:MAG: iron-sulfur cluster assembly accessory protein [Bdellovibrionaceae bacterium]|nr:iron-sulfur cluster assembly accessory protein [Pseudobdellovibrionaceae bacterium]
MIQLTESAAKKLASLKSEEGRADSDLLRVEVKRGGCSGFSYKMDFTSEQKDGDKVFETHGQKLVVDAQSLLYLLGMNLDYEGGLNGKGFVFQNPNASKSCGCGASFAV